ncbi:MAG: hypothetical protein OXR73_15415 [Myxococcales bacterium]|nr:hypothetical protein [Myxococcales bacterium]
MLKRQEGQEQPGIKWGPFTLRIPFVHSGFEGPELLQGLLVAAATGLAIVPLLQGFFGLSFEQAITMSLISAMLISAGPILFGEPFAPGWITPALPLTLNVVLAPDYPTPTAKFQMMTALSLELAAILIFLGMTGLGKRLIEWLPATLKAAIIMGAAIAAIHRVFVSDAPKNLHAMPLSMTVGMGLCLALAFSHPIARWKPRLRWLAYMSSLGLLPGFVAAGMIGGLSGELSWVNPETGASIIRMEVMAPPFASLYEAVSPFAIGFPSAAMFIKAAPLAFITYIILFGDIVTGMAVLESAMPHRPDEKIVFDSTRSHLSTGIRNALMAVFAPFFPTQGALWTGVHVIIVNRWATGKHEMYSLHSGIASYYTFGLPFLLLALPLTTALQPLLPIALALTLILTGFACAYVAMEIPSNPTERGVVVLGASAIAFMPPEWGLAVAALTALVLVGAPKSAEATEADVALSTEAAS